MWTDLTCYLRALVTGIAKDEEGQAMVEYALIVSLVSIAALAALTPLGTAILGAFNSAVNAF